VPTPTERFRALMGRSEFPLDEAALLLAAHAEPDLDVDRQLARLDELAAKCTERSVQGVVDLLFVRLGLHGNLDDYGDPRNSFLNQILDRRTGIPISLSVLTMEIGRRVGVTFEGIGMPGHFLIRVAAMPTLLLDPFHGGRQIGPDGAEELFVRIHGGTAPFSPALLAPTPAPAILARMLFNLRTSYRSRGDGAALGWVGHLLASMPFIGDAEVLETARQLSEVGRFADAAAVLDVLAGRTGNAEGAAGLRAQGARLRARLN
jgi:regulator of sirC expression with transglutaminase-like and TPR domain